MVIAAWLFALLGSVLPLGYPSSLRAVFVFFVLFGGPALLAAAQGTPVLGVRRRGQDGSAVRRGDRVEVERRDGPPLSISLQALDGAWREGDRVILSFRGRVIVRLAGVPADEGDALLASLGFGARRRAARVPIGAPSAAMSRAFFAPFSMLMALVGASLVLGALFAMVGPGAWAFAVMPALFAIGAFAASIALARATLGSTIVLGDDGVWVRRGVATRYVPFSDELEPAARGRKVFLGATELCTASGVVEANELVRQIAHRRDATRAHARTGDAVLADALDRGKNGVREWAEQVKRVAAAMTYRDRAITDEALVAVIEDARAPADRRAAAALALGTRSGDEGKTRVRVAAEACAHPKLRVSLETAADGEIDEGALRAVERALRRSG